MGRSRYKRAVTRVRFGEGYLRMLTLFRDHEMDFTERFEAMRAHGTRLKSVSGPLVIPALHRAATDMKRACAEGAGDVDLEARGREVACHFASVIGQSRGL